MQEVKSAIAEEGALKSYLVALEDLALSHHQETITLRRRIEVLLLVTFNQLCFDHCSAQKINHVNSFLPHDPRGNALRLRLYVLFDLATAPTDDNALVAAGKYLSTVTDYLFSKEVPQSVSFTLNGQNTKEHQVKRGALSEKYTCSFMMAVFFRLDSSFTLEGQHRSIIGRTANCVYSRS